MHVLIIGSLGGELGQAARIATARGARLQQADDDRAALPGCGSMPGGPGARGAPHDVGGLVRALAAERIPVPVVACGTVEAWEAAEAIEAGAREFLPLRPTRT